MQSMVWLRTYIDECIFGFDNLKQTTWNKRVCFSTELNWTELNWSEVISVVGLRKMEVRLPAHKQDSYTKVQILLVNKGDGKYTSFALRAFDLHNSLFNQL